MLLRKPTLSKNGNLAILPIIGLYMLLSGCDDKFETIQPPGVTVTKPTVSKMPTVSLAKTRMLFGLAAKIEVGDKVGLFELRKEGMLIHPGETKPTKVSFKLARSYKKFIVRPFISTLPSDATAVKEAGTVGMEFLLDGKSEGRFMVDRDSTFIKTLYLTNVEVLTVVVDNGEGKPWFDWLILGAVESE
jgi:hypothetical protein